MTNGRQAASHSMVHARANLIFGFLLVFACTQVAFAKEALIGEAQTNIKLGEENIVVGLQGFIGDGSQSNAIRLRVVADLGEFQAKLPGFLREKSMHKEECGDNFELFDLALTPDPPKALLTGQARYEKWYCTSMDVPEFDGLKVRMKTVRTSKNKLVSQSGRAWTWLRAEVSGDAIRLAAEGSGVELNGLGDDLVDFFGLGDELRDVVQGALDDALSKDNAKLVLPDELRDLDIVLTGAQFVTLPDNRLGLEITGETVPSFSLFQTIYTKYLSQ